MSLYQIYQSQEIEVTRYGCTTRYVVGYTDPRLFYGIACDEISEFTLHPAQEKGVTTDET